MRTRSLAFVAAIVVLASACGDSSGPLDSSIDSSTGSGAVIVGTARSSGSSPTGPLTVQAVGTGARTDTNSAGQFTLANVTAGNVELRFTGPGTDARVALGKVSDGETVTIVVQVTARQAQLMDRSSRGGNTDDDELRISGTVLRLSGTASAFTLFLGSREVRGNIRTQFTGEGPSSDGFANLRNGREVEVRGSLSGGVLFATRVDLEDDDDDSDDDDDADDDDDDEFEGVIQAITGQAPDLTLTVGRHLVLTSAATIIRRRGNVVGTDALAVRQEVEVEGSLLANGTVNAAKITIEDAD